MSGHFKPERDARVFVVTIAPSRPNLSRFLSMLAYLWIAAGGALGSMSRFWLSGIVARHCTTFPLGTLLVNISGSFAIGFLATLLSSVGRGLAPDHFRLFLFYGVLGGYTTFSSFSWQTLELARQGHRLQAGVNVLASVALCLVAVWLGYLAAAGLNSMKGSASAHPPQSRSAQALDSAAGEPVFLAREGKGR